MDTHEHAPRSAWVAVALMSIGFLLCTVAFVAHNLIPLWIIGLVVGAVGLVLGRITHLMVGPAVPRE